MKRQPLIVAALFLLTVPPANAEISGIGSVDDLVDLFSLNGGIETGSTSMMLNNLAPDAPPVAPAPRPVLPVAPPPRPAAPMSQTIVITVSGPLLGTAVGNIPTASAQLTLTAPNGAGGIIVVSPIEVNRQKLLQGTGRFSRANRAAFTMRLTGRIVLRFPNGTTQTVDIDQPVDVPAFIDDPRNSLPITVPLNLTPR